MQYDACLFDMDGVIIDTHRAVTAFWNDVARKHGVTLTEADFSQRIYGCPGAQTLDVLFPQVPPGEKRAILAHMKVYEERQQYVPVVGALDFVRSLRRAGILTALVTSGDRPKVAAVAAQLALDGLFDTRVTVEDVARGKPAPDGYRLAAGRLGVAPERCIVFEDSLSGMQAAVAAGATGIGVRQAGGAALLEAGAQAVIPGFTAEHIRLGRADAPPGAGRVLRLAGGLGVWLCQLDPL